MNAQFPVKCANAQILIFRVCVLASIKTAKGKRLCLPPNVTPVNLADGLNDEKIQQGV
jgi:hypothetical protein